MMPSASAIVGYACAYALLAGFSLIEHFVRRGDGTKDMARGRFDGGSTMAISVVMGVAFVIVPLAPVWNWLGIGPPMSVWATVVGVTAGVAGLVIRYFAFSTLGRFFTRTLRQQQDHRLVTAGIYRHIRHPGYLSDLLIFIGASLAMRSLVVFAVVLISFLPVYIYRIRTEERMLVEVFGQEYVAYQQHSKRLVPFIF